MMNTLPQTLLTLDTCVLMHSFTRNLLFSLTKTQPILPIWSEEIGIEWKRNAPRIWKVNPDVVEQEWQTMQADLPLSNMGAVSPYYTIFHHMNQCTEACQPDVSVVHTLSLDSLAQTHDFCLNTPSPTQPSSLFKRIDPKDRHVALCALVARYRFSNYPHSVLLTWNTQDFHRRELREQAIELQTPDEFLSKHYPELALQLPSLCQSLHQEYLKLGYGTQSLYERLRRDKLYRLANLMFK